MGDVSKFIPINGNGENGENNIFGGIGNVVGTTNTTPNNNVTGNPSTEGNTWEAGNVSTGTVNVSGDTNTTWENGNITGTGVTSTTQSGNTTGNSTEGTWKIGNTCTTGTITNGKGVNSSNTCSNGEETITSGFRVCGSSNNLPAKQSFWSKLKSFFFYNAEELAELERQKAKTVVNETTQPQESAWTKIKKLFTFEEDSNKN